MRRPLKGGQRGILPKPDGQVRLLLVLTFLFTFAYSSAFTLVPLLASDLGVPGAAAGVVIAAPGLLSLILGPASAALSNRFGRRPIVLAGFIGLVGSGVGYLLAPSYLWLMPSQLLLGLAIILYWPSAIAALSERARFGRQEAVQGANTLVHSLASFAGAIAPGFLVVLVGYTASFAMYTALAAIGFVIALLLSETLDRGTHSGFMAELRATMTSISRIVSGQRLTVVAAAGNFPWGLLWWVGGGSFFVLYAREAGHSAAVAGVLLGLRTLIASGTRIWFSPLARRFGLLEVMLVGNLLAAFGLGAASLSGTLGWLAGSAVLQGLGLAFVPPATHTLVAYTTGTADRALGQSMPIFFSQAAVLVMPVPLGIAAQYGGLGLSLQLAAAIAGLSVAALWVAAGGQRGRQAAAALIERR